MIDENVFWSKVDKSGDCWLWTGSNRLGYGTFSYKKPDGKRTTMGAHRYSYFLAHGVHPGDKFVCHTCDNPACVRPEHLFLGTHQENMDDMRRKDRFNSPLNNSIVEQARMLAAQGGNVGKFAVENGLDKFSLCQAVRGETWKHVDAPPVVDFEFRTRRKVRKLSHEQVQEILEALKKPYWGQVNDLAAKYGVKHSMISHIKRGYWSPARFNSD